MKPLDGRPGHGDFQSWPANHDHGSLKFFESKIFLKNISPDHLVLVEMIAQPIVGTLCCFMYHFVVESPDPCAWLALPGKNFRD